MIKPFLNLPRWVQGAEDNKWHHIDGRVRPDEIADYYSGINDGTIVVLKCNSSFLLAMRIDEFDELLRDYYFVVETAQKNNLELPVVLSKPDLFGLINVIKHANESN